MGKIFESDGAFSMDVPRRGNLKVFIKYHNNKKNIMNILLTLYSNAFDLSLHHIRAKFLSQSPFPGSNQS